MNKLSLVIPTLNEEENIKPLVREISKHLKKDYEIIFIDDKSTDNTVSEIKKLKTKYPIRYFSKIGKRGKTFSLVEGFKKAKYDYLGMIDADLQYPPLYLPKMLSLIEKDADVVITNRKDNNSSNYRKLKSLFSSSVITLLFGLDFDTQSGLKVFKREVYANVSITTKNEWTFDIDFLVKAKQKGFNIQSIDIKFHPREKGETKTQIAGSKRGVVIEAIKLKFRRD